MYQSSQVMWCEFYFGTHVGYCPEQITTQSFQPYYPPEEDRISKLEDTLVQFMQLSMINQRNTEDSIKRLEDLAGKLSEMIAEHGRNMVEAQGEVEESDDEEEK